MARYIDADELKVSLKKFRATGNVQGYLRGVQDALNDLFPQIIDDVPTADVKSVEHGQWDGYVCSECNICADYFMSGDLYFDEKPNFCPNCGARMGED